MQNHYKGQNPTQPVPNKGIFKEALLATIFVALCFTPLAYCVWHTSRPFKPDMAFIARYDSIARANFYLKIRVNVQDHAARAVFAGIDTTGTYPPNEEGLNTAYDYNVRNLTFDYLPDNK